MGQPLSLLVTRAALALRDPCSFRELLDAAHRLAPQSFGQEGAPHYPSDHKLRWLLSSARGPVRQGYLERAAANHYRLTPKGRQIADGTGPAPVPCATALQTPLTLARSQEAALRRLLESDAARQFEVNKWGLSVAHATEFWRLFCLRGKTVQQRLQDTEALLNELEALLATRAARLTNGRVVTAGDIRVLHRLHDYLRERFAQAIARMGK